MLLQSYMYIFPVLHFPPNVPCLFPTLDHHLDCFPPATASAFHVIIFLNLVLIFCPLYNAFLLVFPHCSNYYNTIISTTSFLILLYSALHCLALKLLLIVPPREEAFFFVPKLGSCRNSFCVLFSTHRIAEQTVGASYTLDSLLLFFQEPVHLASHLSSSKCTCAFVYR